MQECCKNRLRSQRAHCLGLLLLSLASAEIVSEAGPGHEPVKFDRFGQYAGDKPLPEFYHTSKDLRAFATELAAPGPGHCPGLRLIRSTFPTLKSTAAKPITELEGEAAWNYKGSEHEGVLDTITISLFDSSIRKPTLRYALFFGEHGRELISAEVGMYLLKAFCGHADVDSAVRSRAQELLSVAEVLILPNVDESGRQSAEQGKYCDRDNFEQVDLNRNWGYKWDSSSTHETYPGPEAFSEPETQIAQKQLEAFKPNAFLSVHSGDRALWLPGAYEIDDTAAKERKGAAVWNNLLAIGSHVKDYTHCNCKIGAPGKLANKRHPGTSIDYAGLQMNIPYAMAWEIWMQSASDCLPRFSPIATDEYARVLQKWSLAMVYFGEAADAALRGLEPTHYVLAPPRANHSFNRNLRHQNRMDANVLGVDADDPTQVVHLRSEAEKNHRRTILSGFALSFLILVCMLTGVMFQKRHTMLSRK